MSKSPTQRELPFPNGHDSGAAGIHRFEANLVPGAQTQPALDELLLGDRSSCARECLALVLGSQKAAQEVVALGRDVHHLSVPELEQIPNVGGSRAARIRAIVELSRHLVSVPLRRGQIIGSPQAVYDAWAPRLRQLHQEAFVAIYMDVKARVMLDKILFLGAIDQCPVAPADVLGPALRLGAPRIIVAHSHPSSGDPQPSKDDQHLTENLCRAASAVRVQIDDHVIIGDGRYFSFLEAGLMPRTPR